MKPALHGMFLTAVIAVGAPAPAAAQQGPSIPSVVVTIENAAPSRGAFQTPFWIGIHDGEFDLYDRDVPLGASGLVPAPAVERLAEDGATGPISEAFSTAQPNAPQATLFGPSGPLAPGDRSSITLNVDPDRDLYFSYASMVIPSNDAFVANGNPRAHLLFNSRGRFVGDGFAVAGSEVLDAGTEVNDEIAANTAFLNQAGPDIGVPEDGTVVLHEGLRGDLMFPDGVLNHPALMLADFLAMNYRVADISFRFVDLGRTTRFRSTLSADQEVTGALIDSNGRGRASAVSRRANRVNLRITFSRLTGPVVAAHLHLGAEGTNGPVVADFSSDVRNRSIVTVITAEDVVGPLAGQSDPMLALLNELAAGNVYINLHTAANPGGEIRGQVELQ